MIGATDPARWKTHTPERLGLMSGYVWATDPKHLLFTLARYKFVAKMLAGRWAILEVGCADAFGTRLVAQGNSDVVGIDCDPEMVESARATVGAWPIEIHKHNILDRRFRYMPDRDFDAAYAIDVLEHISFDQEDQFLANMAASVIDSGQVIIGMPSLESQAHASEASREGHVNCKTLEGLRATCARHFTTVLMFGMNDEMVHTGYGPLCHYLWAVCAGKR